MAADQRARHFRPALAQMDMVLHHHGWGGRTRNGVGRTQPARRSESNGARDSKPDGGDLVQGVDHRGCGIFGGAIDSHHRDEHIGHREVD